MLSDYHLRYGYLKLVKFPNEAGSVPTFKEEQLKLTKEEVEHLLAALEEHRESINQR